LAQEPNNLKFPFCKKAADAVLSGGNQQNVENNRKIIPDWNPRPGGGLGN